MTAISVLLEVSNLKKMYRSRARMTPALDGVSVEVGPGEIVGLLGPNGAGKTTLVKCACGLILPDSGRIRVAGYDPVKERATALPQLGAVLEGNRNIYWQLSPRQNLWYFGRLRNVPGAIIAQRTQPLLASLGLGDHADQPTKTLSRGTQQRAAVAVALIHDPSVLLLDEPTLGLDVSSTEAIVEQLRRLAGEGKAILVTTHQLELAEGLCNRIAIIRRGRILVNEPTPQLLRRFEADRATVVCVAGVLRGEDITRLSSAYPGLSVKANGNDTWLRYSARDGTAPESLFVDLWRAGYAIRSFDRSASLREVYLQVVGDTSEESERADADALA
jgi:ABC-2 type transport system ATP-binding protein